MPEGWELVANSSRCRIARHGGHGVRYKEFLPRPGDRLLAWIGRGRARRAQRNNEALLLSGFPAPETVGRGRLPGGREYLFTRVLPGENVAHWLRHALAARDAATLSLRRGLLRDLGTFIGRLHNTGYIHGDLSPRHIIATYKGGQFRFSLVDNENNRLRRPPPGRWILKNLVQLNLLTSGDLTRSDRWRFFLMWRQQHPELGHLESRLLAVEAYRLAMRRLR